MADNLSSRDQDMNFAELAAFDVNFVPFDCVAPGRSTVCKHNAVIFLGHVCIRLRIIQ